MDERTQPGGLAPLGQAAEEALRRLRESRPASGSEQNARNTSAPPATSPGDSLDRWPKTALARLLPKGSRALCEACYGTGLAGDPEEVAGCARCGVVNEAEERTETAIGVARFVSYEPCEVHVCPMCLGKGVVCPDCRGARFLREPTARGNRAVRCPSCTEGNNVSAAREMAAIRRELARFGL